MSTDDPNRKATQPEVAAMLGPIFAKLVREHGKTDAIRMFKIAVVEAGFHPDEMRVIFDEDLS